MQTPIIASQTHTVDSHQGIGSKPHSVDSHYRVTDSQIRLPLEYRVTTSLCRFHLEYRVINSLCRIQLEYRVIDSLCRLPLEYRITASLVGTHYSIRSQPHCADSLQIRGPHTHPVNSQEHIVQQLYHASFCCSGFRSMYIFTECSYHIQPFFYAEFSFPYGCQTKLEGPVCFTINPLFLVKNVGFINFQGYLCKSISYSWIKNFVCQSYFIGQQLLHLTCC